MSTIYRTDKSKGNYTIINNSLLRDKELLPQARFLLCLTLSLPEDWRYLTSKSGAGISVVKTALRDLEKRG